MRVAILGCGPAGLMAAHAAAVSGADVLIYSKARPSELYGCQYLHAPIPGVTTGEPVLVKYRLQGTEEGYRSKVYGANWTGTVSPGDMDSEHYAWDIRQAYDRLWRMYGRFVQDTDFAETSIPRLLADIQPDLTFSTIPLPVLCQDPYGHRFHSESIYALGDAPPRGQKVPYHVPEGTVVCDGTRDRGWYRASNVFGYSTIEWPGSKKPPVSGVAEVKKPLGNTCDCLPEVKRLGRYGKWEKGVLSHDAFFETRKEIMLAMENGTQPVLEGL